MNPIESVITGLQHLMSLLPPLLQPVVVALAGAIPFVEGEVGGVLGVWAGLPPVVAGIAAAAGNFACVAVIVLLGARIRESIRAARERRAARSSDVDAIEKEQKPESKGRRRFKNFLVRFGVPGASLLGPLVLPTQFTSAILVSTGVKKSWILLWQGIAIVLWTTLTTAIAAGVLALVQG